MFRVHRARINPEGPHAHSHHGFDQSLLDHQRFLHEHKRPWHEHEDLHMQRCYDKGIHPRTYMPSQLHQDDAWQPRRPTPNARGSYGNGQPMQRWPEEGNARQIPRHEPYTCNTSSYDVNGGQRWNDGNRHMFPGECVNPPMYPNFSQMHRVQEHDHHMHGKVREVSVTLVYQDSECISVFRDDSFRFYTTPRLWEQEHSIRHIAAIEHMNGGKIVDVFGNVYRALDWDEILNLTWEGRALFESIEELNTKRIRDLRAKENARESSLVDHHKVSMETHQNSSAEQSRQTNIKGSCCECGIDHLIRDCPESKQEPFETNLGKTKHKDQTNERLKHPETRSEWGLEHKNETEPFSGQQREMPTTETKQGGTKKTRQRGQRKNKKNIALQSEDMAELTESLSKTKLNETSEELKPSSVDKNGKTKAKNKESKRTDEYNSYTTLPIKRGNLEFIAILDSGASISIATRQIWEKWGKPTLKASAIALQFADGSVKQPIGLLENFKVQTCGIKYRHTFAVMDFSHKPEHEVILGRPFMRQFQMIEDWGFNYLYLRHNTDITRVYWKNHSHIKVKHMPTDDLYSLSSNNSDSESSILPSWVRGTKEQGGNMETKAKSKKKEKQKKTIEEKVLTVLMIGTVSYESARQTYQTSEGLHPSQTVSDNQTDLGNSPGTLETASKTHSQRSYDSNETQKDGNEEHGMYIEINIYLQNLILPVDACISDAQMPLNFMSFEIWKTLGKPELKPIDVKSQLSGFQIFLGTFATDIEINGQKRRCFFRVCNEGKMLEEVTLSQMWIQRGDAIFNQTNTQTQNKPEPKTIENPKTVIAEPKPIETNQIKSSEMTETVIIDPSHECLKYVGHCSECWQKHYPENCEKRQRPNVNYVEIILRSPEMLFIVYSLVEYDYDISIMTQNLWILLGQPKLLPLPAESVALKDLFLGVFTTPIRIFEQRCYVMLYVLKHNYPALAELVVSPESIPADVVLMPIGTTQKDIIKMSFLRQVRALEQSEHTRYQERRPQFPQQPQTSTPEQVKTQAIQTQNTPQPRPIAESRPIAKTKPLSIAKPQEPQIAKEQESHNQERLKTEQRLDVGVPMSAQMQVAQDVFVPKVVQKTMPTLMKTTVPPMLPPMPPTPYKQKATTVEAQARSSLKEDRASSSTTEKEQMIGLKNASTSQIADSIDNKVEHKQSNSKQSRQPPSYVQTHRRYVYIPKDQLPQRRPGENDKFVWVSSGISTANAERGYITTQKQTEAYATREKERWMPKKLVTAYALLSQALPILKKQQRKPSPKTDQQNHRKPYQKWHRRQGYRNSYQKHEDRWISKKLLQAQGYYKGQVHVWVPKRCQPKLYHKSNIIGKPTSLPTTRPKELVRDKSLSRTVEIKIWKPKTTAVRTTPRCLTIKERAALLCKVLKNDIHQDVTAHIFEHYKETVKI